MFNKFVKALILVEDGRFYTHHGIDLLSICRAFLVNLNRKRFAHGGSTITQQLARTLYLNNKKTISRKLKEIAIAFYLELTHTKKEILSLYTRSVYMGHDKKGKRISGLVEASRFYFNKSIFNLSLAEYAAIIAMIKGPNFYKIDSDSGIARRIFVLSKMLDNNVITKEEFFEASQIIFD